MPLSAKKRSQIERHRRTKVLQARALRGIGPYGYWMDASDQGIARRYLETGDDRLLEQLPDYRKNRR